MGSSSRRLPARAIGRCFCTGFVALALVAPLAAQAPDRGADTNVPEYVSDLIVHIEAFKPRREDGAGIVVGEDSAWVYIATAAHVITFDRDQSIVADSVRVEFASERTFVSATIDTFSVDLDLGVIRVSREAAVSAGYRAVLDRLGDSNAIRPGSEVSPVGCPGSNCWRAPSPADRVLSANPVEILFQTSFVRGGSSGGGIFNRWDEVVGMVSRVEPPGAYALPMDFVVGTIQAWGRPVSIRKPGIPRGGYLTSIGVSVMAPTTGRRLPDGRVPSGRLTLTRAIQDPFDINISVLRIAPGDVGTACPVSAKPGDPLTTIVTLRERAPCEAVVNAVTIGFGARAQLGRLTVRPFAEFGMGRVRGRYDIGGVYEFVEVEYLPNFKAVEQTGFGGGGGLTLDYVLLPRTILQGLFGYWRFQDPFEGAELPAGFVPAMPASYIGFGLRWGM